MSINFDQRFSQSEIECDICGYTEEVDAEEFMEVVSYKQQSDEWLSTNVKGEWFDCCSIGCFKKARAKGSE